MATPVDAANSEELELLRATTLGEYEILGELGRGGMATVYAAHDIALDRRVAIKVISPSLGASPALVERFRREARTAASLSHPNIIPIYSVRHADRLLYFVMKHVDGRPLDSILRETGALPVPTVQAILGQVAGAVGYAHRHGVVHRDIKPGNILIDDEGWCVVTDFGIAKVAESEGLTTSGMMVGTPAYMSPEQCLSNNISGASDQYALGVVAYEMLTGRLPFPGTSMMSVMYAHVHVPVPAIEELRTECPPELAGAVMRMLAKEPGDRWPSIEEAVAALGQLTAVAGRADPEPADHARDHRIEAADRALHHAAEPDPVQPLELRDIRGEDDPDRCAQEPEGSRHCGGRRRDARRRGDLLRALAAGRARCARLPP